MKSIILTLIVAIAIATISFITLFYFFPKAEISSLIESSLLITGLFGFSYSIPLARKELENISYNSIPKVVHTGVFDFFNKSKQVTITSLSATAFNIYGWVVNNEEMKRIIFVHGVDTNNITKGDVIHVWLPSKGEKKIEIEVNPSKKALNIQNHIVLIYEDGSGNKYFSLMTENYRYSFGKLSYKEIANILKTQARRIESFEISSSYE